MIDIDPRHGGYETRPRSSRAFPEGERDDTLFREACRLRRQLGDGARRAVEILILHAAANCTPPFPEAEALRKVDQAFRQERDELEYWMVAWARGLAEQREAGTHLLNLKRGVGDPATGNVPRC